MGHNKSSCKREMYSLLQEIRKISPSLTPKGTEIIINKTQSKQKERNHKDQCRNKWNKKQNKPIKRSMKLRTGSLKRLQNWQTFSQTYQENKERAKVNKIRNEKRSDRNTEDHKRLLQTMKQPRRNGQIPISVQSPKTEWIRNMNR